MVDRIERIEHGERILENCLDFAPKQHPVFSAQCMDVLAFIQDLTGGGRDESQ